MRVGVARASSEDADGGVETTTTRGAEYFKGFVTEPVETTARELASEERDIWTPTITLVMRSAGVLTALFVGFWRAMGCRRLTSESRRGLYYSSIMNK